MYGRVVTVGERGDGMKLVYNIDFGITAAVFLIVLYIYVKLQYSSYSEVNRTFQKVVVITLMADVLDVLTAITISYGSQVPIAFNTLLNTLYYICVACMELYFFSTLICVCMERTLLRIFFYEWIKLDLPVILLQ